MPEIAAPVRAVLWDADGVLQITPERAWDLAVEVVARFPGALTGAPIDEGRVRAVVSELGQDDRVEEVVAVWSSFEVLSPTLEVVGLVRANGTPCYLATNQDALRAARMRALTPYGEVLDGAYYSCDVGAAKPSAGFFEHVVADLGLEPEELLFLDDQAANVTAARSVGLGAEQWCHEDGVPRLRELLEAHGVRLDRPGTSSVRSR